MAFARDGAGRGCAVRGEAPAGRLLYRFEDQLHPEASVLESWAKAARETVACGAGLVDQTPIGDSARAIESLASHADAIGAETQRPKRLRTIEAPDGTVLLERHYDPQGRLIRVDYPEGRFVKYQRDDRGLLVRSVLEDGRSIDFVRNGNGHLQSTRYPDSVSFGYVTDKLGRVTQCEFPDGRSAEFGFDSSGRLSSVKAQEAQLSFKWSPSGHARRVRVEVLDTSLEIECSRKTGKFTHSAVSAPDGGTLSCLGLWTGADPALEGLVSLDGSVRRVLRGARAGTRHHSFWSLSGQELVEHSGRYAGVLHGNGARTVFVSTEQGVLGLRPDGVDLFRLDREGRVAAIRSDRGGFRTLERCPEGRIELIRSEHGTQRFRRDPRGRLVEVSAVGQWTVKFRRDSTGQVVRTRVTDRIGDVLAVSVGCARAIWTAEASLPRFSVEGAVEIR